MFNCLCSSRQAKNREKIECFKLAVVPYIEIAANFIIMLFKDTKQGYPIYFLDRENVGYYQGKVVSVAVPRYDNMGGQQHTGLVVDVTIEANGQTRTYTIPEASTIAYASNLTISTDKDGILREVEALKNVSEEALAKVDKHKEIVTKCHTLLEELNPVFAEKRAQDRRIEGIESEVKSLGTMLKDFINEFKK